MWAAVAVVIVAIAGMFATSTFWAGETTQHVQSIEESELRTEAKVDAIDLKLDGIIDDVAQLAANQARMEGYLSAKDGYPTFSMAVHY